MAPASGGSWVRVTRGAPARPCSGTPRRPRPSTLYLGEVSASAGLALFDPATPLTIVTFGATGYRRLGWATERDIPALATVGAACAFLDGNAPLGLIEIEARLGDNVSFGSHEDGECHLDFQDRQALMAILQRIVPAAFGGKVVHAALVRPAVLAFEVNKVDATLASTMAALLQPITDATAQLGRASATAKRVVDGIRGTVSRDDWRGGGSGGAIVGHVVKTVQQA